MSADYAVHGSVAVITLNNPPVNGLGMVTRTAAVEALRRAEGDETVKAVVITGAGKVFSGGADIREFNSPKALAEPNLHTLIATAEGLRKPVVAAIHGVCMGGGLELSLGCHYRVATRGAQIGLPEVKIGLVPGAGGTRYCRNSGPRRACSTACSTKAPTWSRPPSSSPPVSPMRVRCRACAT
jgi:3-hydroxyacyl-CoA dehydrogenase